VEEPERERCCSCCSWCLSGSSARHTGQHIYIRARASQGQPANTGGVDIDFWPYVASRSIYVGKVGPPFRWDMNFIFSFLYYIYIQKLIELSLENIIQEKTSGFFIILWGSGVRRRKRCVSARNSNNFKSTFYFIFLHQNFNLRNEIKIRLTFPKWAGLFYMCLPWCWTTRWTPATVRTGVRGSKSLPLWYVCTAWRVW
jgi:hypothetical protein